MQRCITYVEYIYILYILLNIYIYIIMNIYIYTNIYIYYWIYIYILQWIYIYIYIYIIPAKEHQVVDRSGAEEILISETLLWKYLEYVHLILQNYKN